MDVVADIFRPVFLNLSRIWSLEGPFPPSEEAVEVHSARFESILDRVVNVILQGRRRMFAAVDPRNEVKTSFQATREPHCPFASMGSRMEGWICNLTAPVPNNVWRAVELACNVAEKTWHRTNREAITEFVDKARLGARLL
jgi:hypothetical protein